MITILFRTLVIYVALTTAVRLMGKRQIGELESVGDSCFNLARILRRKHDKKI